jgi:hypothetical protein
MRMTKPRSLSKSTDHFNQPIAASATLLRITSVRYVVCHVQNITSCWIPSLISEQGRQKLNYSIEKTVESKKNDRGLFVDDQYVSGNVCQKRIDIGAPTGRSTKLVPLTMCDVTTSASQVHEMEC